MALTPIGQRAVYETSPRAKRSLTLSRNCRVSRYYQIIHVNMVRLWKCEICSIFIALSLKELVRQIGVEHAGMPNFKVRCGIDGCTEEYCKMNSFRKHLRTCYSNVYSNSNTGDSVNISEQQTSIIHNENEQEWNLHEENQSNEINDEVVHDERETNQVCI